MRIIVHGDNGVAIFSYETRMDRRSIAPSHDEMPAVIAALDEALAFLRRGKPGNVLPNGNGPRPRPAAEAAVADGQPAAYPMRRGI